MQHSELYEADTMEYNSSDASELEMMDIEVLIGPDKVDKFIQTDGVGVSQDIGPQVQNELAMEVEGMDSDATADQQYIHFLKQELIKRGITYFK